MVPRRPRSYLKTLASLSRINLMHELQQNGSMTVMELAAATGLHHNTAREHLHRLIEAGFVCSEPIPSTSRGRPRVLYRAATDPTDPIRRSRRHAADVRTAQYPRVLPIREAGSSRTALDQQLDNLDDHMIQSGFTATVEVNSLLMTMHECPYSDLAKDNPQVCQVHFALVKDALNLTDGPLKAHALHPFSEPAVCTLDLVRERPETAV
ncbi:hypothetical protein BH09ACT4_BH09ACT4_05850 [soil metagenome]